MFHCRCETGQRRFSRRNHPARCNARQQRHCHRIGGWSQRQRRRQGSQPNCRDTIPRRLLQHSRFMDSQNGHQQGRRGAQPLAVQPRPTPIWWHWQHGNHLCWADFQIPHRLPCPHRRQPHLPLAGRTTRMLYQRPSGTVFGGTLLPRPRLGAG